MTLTEEIEWLLSKRYPDEWRIVYENQSDVNPCLKSQKEASLELQMGREYFQSLKPEDLKSLLDKEKRKEHEKKILGNLIMVIKSSELPEESRFIEKMSLFIGVIKELEKEKEIGQLPTNGEIRRELNDLIQASNACKKALNRLRKDTWRLLDEKDINSALPLSPDKHLPLVVLLDALNNMIAYSNSIKKELDLRDRNDFFQLEDMIAAEFELCGGTIMPTEDGSFAELLRALREHCDIEGYHPDNVSSTHIRRIMKKLKQNTNT